MQPTFDPLQLLAETILSIEQVNRVKPSPQDHVSMSADQRGSSQRVVSDLLIAGCQSTHWATPLEAARDVSLLPLLVSECEPDTDRYSQQVGAETHPRRKGGRNTPRLSSPSA